MAQLAGGDEKHEKELLQHGVACPRIAQHRADEVHRVLDEGESVGDALHLLRPDGLKRLVAG